MRLVLQGHPLIPRTLFPGLHGLLKYSCIPCKLHRLLLTVYVTEYPLLLCQAGDCGRAHRQHRPRAERRCLHELSQVVAVRHGCFKVLDGALADGELIAVRQQTVQTFQHPQQDAGSLLGQLFDEEGIIHPGRVTVFHRDEDLSAPEAVAVIVSGHKVAIAEADETNVQQTLDSLLVFPLDAQTVLGGDDGLDVRFREHLAMHF